MSQRQYWRQGWDNVIAVADEFGQPGAPWDGGVRNYVYDTGSMTWVAETQPSGGGSGGDASAANQVIGNASLSSIDTKLTSQATAAKQDTLIAGLQALNSLVPSVFDYIELAYTGSDLTEVIYRTGGSGGSIVSTLDLTYSDSVLQTVTRS